MERTITYAEAMREAADICLGRDASVFLMGLGVSDPKGIFGTTLGLQQKYGEQRVFDIPCSENAITGVAVGAALRGMRPVLTHQRLDFALLSMEQIVNQAAKWFYMFGGQTPVPLMIRMVLGRGWGQGAQHSQSLQAWFAHVPGLKVVMPATPLDAKGLFIAGVEDDNPVIYLDHRWLHSVSGIVPDGHYSVPIGKARVAREGDDFTVVAVSYAVLEALRASEWLAAEGVSCEVIDLRTVSPLDMGTVLSSVKKTGRLAVMDTGCKSFGIGAEIVARIAEINPALLRAPVLRLASPDVPAPASPALAAEYYPRAAHLASSIMQCLGRSPDPEWFKSELPLDIPDPKFKGPF